MAVQTPASTDITKVSAGLVVKARYTGVSDSDLLQIPVGADSGTIVRRDYVLVSGTGTAITYTTFNTALSTASDVQVETWSTTAAAYLSDATSVPFWAPDQNLWSDVTITGGGSDNVIIVVLYISTRFV